LAEAAAAGPAGGPSAGRELRDFLGRLPDGPMAERMALLWLGRAAGDVGPGDFAGLVAHALGSLDRAPAYVAGKAPLARYLREGVRRLRGAAGRDPLPGPAAGPAPTGLPGAVARA
jgi:hypothetical protein